MEQSSVSLMPSRVEISLVKADPGSWAQLEHPDALAEKAKAEVGLEMDEEESEDSDDDLSWTGGRGGSNGRIVTPDSQV